MRQINRGTSNLVVYIWGIHTDMGIPKTVRKKMRYICHSELRRSLRLQKEGRHFTGKWEEQMFGK